MYPVPHTFETMHLVLSSQNHVPCTIKIMYVHQKFEKKIGITYQ